MDEKLAKVSVVIVNYNAASLILNLIESFGSMIEDFLSVTVVDNCSKDNSVSELKNYLDEKNLHSIVTLIDSSINGGFSYGNNLAIKEILANAELPEFIYLLNPDTYLEKKGSVMTMVDFMLENPNVGISGSQLKSDKGFIQCSAFRFPTIMSELSSALKFGLLDFFFEKWIVAPKVIPETPTQVDWVAGASMLIRRQVFRDIGLMDEAYFLYFEETDFCLLAKRKGWQCWYVPESELIHYVGQSTGVVSGDKRRLRRPKYWFESRQRYFMKNHGLLYTVIADLAWGFGFATWRLRRWIQRKPDTDPVHMLQDFWRNSIFFSWIK